MLGITLGEGTYGCVKKALYKDKEVAVKKFYEDDDIEDTTLREILALQVLRGMPNIVQCLCVELGINTKVYLTLHKTTLFSLSSLIPVRKRILSAEDVAIQILRGLWYCHAQQIVHCDIKPSNILVDFENEFENLRCYIVDFGLSCQTTLEKKFKREHLFTPQYKAPELFADPFQDFNGKVDFWALGCTICEYITGADFLSQNVKQDIVMNLSGGYDKEIKLLLEKQKLRRSLDVKSKLSKFNIKLSSSLFSLLQSLLQIHPDDRKGLDSNILGIEECHLVPPQVLRKFIASNQINKRMYYILVEWLCNVAESSRKSCQMLVLTIDILDRFMSIDANITICEFQLVGITCFLIADKLLSAGSESISTLLHLCCDAYSHTEMRKLQARILKSLDFIVQTREIDILLDLSLDDVMKLRKLMKEKNINPFITYTEMRKLIQ